MEKKKRTLKKGAYKIIADTWHILNYPYFELLEMILWTDATKGFTAQNYYTNLMT